MCIVIPITLYVLQGLLDPLRHEICNFGLGIVTRGGLSYLSMLLEQLNLLERIKCSQMGDLIVRKYKVKVGAGKESELFLS